jgi:hypothetical protein
MCIFVDCNWGKKNKDVSDKYAIRGYPTVVFTDPEGKEIDRLKARDSGSVLTQIDDVAKKYPRK